MVIIEGMDGTGKTRLGKLLSETYDIPIHERASTSKGGPIDNLYDWAEVDLRTFGDQKLAIYDRHPFISQYVYATILNKHNDDRFFSSTAQVLIRKLARESLIIFCDPGFDQTLSNCLYNQDQQMEGVADNFLALYNQYRVIRQFWPLPSNTFVWDYNNPLDAETLHFYMKSHMNDHFRRYN